MDNLRADIAGYYRERETLFQDRWALGPLQYAKRAADLNATIYGYELLLCRHFRESLRVIFPPEETRAE